MKQSLKTKLKQLWFPKAFRLPEPEFSKDQIDLLEELIQLIHPTLSKVEATTRDERVHMAHFLVDLGTGIWRIRRKIEGLTRMPKEIRDALYSLESTWMSMSEGGVEIVDHIGAIPGKNEAKVVEVRDIPNLVREQVVDAVKPTILLRGEVIQLGEVIMGRPLKNGATATQPSPTEQTEPEDPIAEAAVMEPREEEDAPPSETYQVETLSLEPQLETASEGTPETSAANDTEMIDTLGTPQDETPAETWPEMPAGDTAVSPELLLEPQEESIPHQAATGEIAEEPAEPMTETSPFDEDGGIVPQSAEPLLEMIEEATGEEIAATLEPTPEEVIEAIESEQPAVAGPDGDIDVLDTLDVPDVPPAPKAKRKTPVAKKGTKAKIAKKAVKEETEEGDGEARVETPLVRKPARPKRKRPVKTEEPVETEVEADG